MADDQIPAQPLAVVGWREHVGLPEWGVRSLVAKLDTGARTSSIHVGAIEPLGPHRVRFELILSRRDPRRRRWLESDHVRLARVRSSSGHVTERYVMRTPVLIGPPGNQTERCIEIGLVCRRPMLYRMLLGRSALGGLVVDPARTFVLGRRRRAPERAP